MGHLDATISPEISEPSRVDAYLYASSETAVMSLRGRSPVSRRHSAVSPGPGILGCLPGYPTGAVGLRGPDCLFSGDSALAVGLGGPDCLSEPSVRGRLSIGDERAGIVRLSEVRLTGVPWRVTRTPPGSTGRSTGRRRRRRAPGDNIGHSVGQGSLDCTGERSGQDSRDAVLTESWD